MPTAFIVKLFARMEREKTPAADESQRQTISLNNNYTIKLSPISEKGIVTNVQEWVSHDFAKVWNGDPIHPFCWYGLRPTPHRHRLAANEMHYAK